jgi:hypothetical protein
MASKPMNRNLGAAKSAKQDEFYTQYVDIQKEVEACRCVLIASCFNTRIKNPINAQCMLDI